MRRQSSSRALKSAVRYAIEALEDRTLLNSYVVTNVNNSGSGSLRDAIQQANSNSGFDAITFNIPGGGVQKIAPTFFLPQITDPVSIDATTQPGYAGKPLIELDGSQAGNCNGLEIKVGGNVIAGLDIHSFAFDGIVFAEPTGPGAVGGNSILKNFIGTDPTGTVAMPNHISGVHLIYSPHDLIQGNLISGNAQSGVFVADQYSTGTTIVGNLIGTDITGMLPLGNKLNGVALGAPPSPTPGDGFASGNVVGSTTPALRNVISGNGQAGVWIKGGDKNIVEGNDIGVAADGVTPLANGTAGTSADPRFGIDGVLIDGATNTIIGGAADHAGNIISANNRDGIQIINSATGTAILGNFVGTTADGLSPLPNGRDGVAIFDSTGNSVGGTDPGSRNVISGNKEDGVFLGAGALGSGAVANQVLGNSIGLDVTGLTALPNTVYGVEINSSVNNIIGGTSLQARNTISGNTKSGIVIGGSATGNQVLGNLIGTDITGLLARPNGLDGIDIFGSSLNVIGGTTAAARNIISGNASDGIVIGDKTSTGNVIAGNYIGTDITGLHALANVRNGLFLTALITPNGPVGTVVGGSTPGAGNVISGNGNDGIQITSSTTTTTVLGNFVGTDSTGAKALPNGRHGVALFDSSGNTIGAAGTPSASGPAGNVISGNTGSGVVISGAASGTASSNNVLGNFIGMDITGLVPVPNVQDGVLIESAAGNTIGGAASARNVISGNGSAGVVITGTGATDNFIESNYIGADVTGAAPAPNSSAGIFINNAPNNVVGGGADKRNLISGNDGVGLYINGKDATANLIQGNYIGTDSTGAKALGNQGDGVRLDGAPGNFIGAAVAGQGNVISGNEGDGVAITGATAANNQLYQNFIGTDPAATIKEGNQRYGVEAFNGANHNVIGGVLKLQPNTIVFNGASLAVKGYGVEVTAGASNSIRANSIFENAGRGIDLVNLASPDTFTINDFQDSTHPNDPVQDAPVVTGVAASGSNTVITFTLNSTPNTVFKLDFFSNSEPSPSGFGDGRTFVTSDTVTTDSNGNVTVGEIFHPDEKFISATATDPTGNTSEFSMIDSDADGLADAWETRGIDIDEDGTVDLTLPGANPMRKDIYVEVDAMQSVVPNPGALQIVIDSFAAAPVANPDGSTGITLHAALNEVIPDQTWFGDRNGNGVDALGEDRNANGKLDPGEDVNGNGRLDYGDPADQDPFVWFRDIKQTGVHGIGGFGDSDEQRSNSAAMDAKRLTYRYALFALGFAVNRPVGGPTNGVGGTDVTTSGIAEVGGNDLIVTLNYGWAGTTQQQAGTFMHELGHTLGLRHGGGDDLNTKPNYNSVMNYNWTTPQDWMKEDTNGNGIQDFNDINHNGVKDPGEPFTEFDLNGNKHFGDFEVWSPSYSDTVINPLDENNLVESNGIGGIAGRWEPVGPKGNFVLETGPVDWSQSDADHDGTANNDTITTGLDINGDGITGEKFNGFNDWSHIQYYFGENPQAADGAPESPDIDGELNIGQWEALNAQGPGPGLLEFQQTSANVSEGDREAEITVIRGAGTNGAVSVNYSTSDGTATAGSDYLAASGTLNFADGEYVKTFTIPIFDDSIAEHTETIHLTLSQTTGGALLSQDTSTATLNIIDNDNAGHFFVTNTLDSGPGSLRQAILNANNHFGQDLIDFNIGGGGVHTITPLSPLPFISDAVTIDGTTQPGFTGNPIIELSGQSTFGSGLYVTSSSVTIRGMVINRWGDAGIEIFRPNNIRPFAFHVEGNYIGTDVTGMTALGNRWGVLVDDGNGVIGGTTAATRNVISGNTLDGVDVDLGFFVAVRGDYIGVAADGTTALGNLQDGVLIPANGAVNTTVGGLDPGAANVIAFNGNDGVENWVPDNGNAILSNSIYGNKVVGINVGAGTAADLNDSGLTDTTFSDPQNYPVLTSAMSSGGQITISGHLNSRPNRNYLLQFFSNPTTTASGYGQGKTLIGSANVTTDGNGYVEFTVAFSVAVANRQLIAATATDPGNNTSEFSVRLAVGDVLGNVYTVNTTDDVDDGIADATHTSLREAIFAANNHPGPDTIRFAIGSGVQTIAPLVPLPAIIDSITIDATTQPGYAGTPLIQIVGTKMEHRDLSGSPGDVHLVGLLLRANDSTIKGFAINSFYSFFDNTSDTSQWGGVPLAVGGNNNVIQGNFFGTDVTGTQILKNLQAPTVSGNNNLIGGAKPNDRNIISGNLTSGLNIHGDNNIIQGNLIGTDVTGTKALANGRGTAFGSFAIAVGGNNNTIGGTAPGAGNVISGNLGDALNVGGAGTLVQGNFIGTDITGTKAMANPGGTGIIAGSGVTIGGTIAAARNIIANNSFGIQISGAGVVVQGNFIGTDITGTVDMGNLNDGIFDAASNTLIGGTAPGAGNLISGNNRSGITVAGSSGVVSGDVIEGNFIGTKADGVSPLGNGFDGVSVAADFGLGTNGFSVIGGMIGGTDPGAGNVIAFNGHAGVNILAGQNIGILSNRIFANASLGIDLNGNGVTPNDAGDADSGDNNLQNYPVLATAATDGVKTTITGTLNSAPGAAFLLQFFANAAADPTGFGQGQTPLGAHFVSTDASGNASFTFTFNTAVPVGQFITATATDLLNNTSEFSQALAMTSGVIAPNRPPTANAGGPYTINEGDTLALDGSLSDDPDSDPITISWDINGDGVFGDATGPKPTFTWAQLAAFGIVNGPSSFAVKVRVDDGQGHVVISSPTTLAVLNVAPTVDAEPSLQQVFEVDPVNLKGTFTDPGTQDTYTLNWHVTSTNGQVIADGSGANFSFVPNDNGTYMATFTVTDSDGGIGSSTVQINVSNVPPVAHIIGLPAQGQVGVPINLTAPASDISPVDTAAGFQYSWEAFQEDDEADFFASTPDFSFTPTVPGTYDVFLHVYDKDFGVARDFQTIVIVAAPGVAPTVSAGPDATINEGDHYASSGSFIDPDDETWTATVDYGDGSGAQPLDLNDDKTFDLDHVYNAAGTFGVVVTVLDSSGLSGSATTHVTVKNVITPTSLAAASASGTYGGQTTLSATLSAAGTGIAGKLVTFQLNGAAVGTAATNASGVATLPAVSLVGLNAGQVGITALFAGDAQYASTNGTATLTIAKAPLSVVVDGKSRVYGQNNPQLTGTLAGVVGGDNISAVYSTIATNISPVGPYPIGASLLDPSGRLGNYNVSITPGTLTVLKTTLAGSGSFFTTSEGTPLVGTVVATFTSDNPIATTADFSASIDWGDGHTSFGNVVLAAGTFQVVGSNTYADNGNYSMAITIHDNAGQGSASQTAQATVLNVPPNVTLGTVPPITVGTPFTIGGSFTDPGADTWTAVVNYGDGTGNLPLTLAADKTFSLNHTYSSAGTFSILVSVTDDDGGKGTAGASVTATIKPAQTSIAATAASATYGGTTTLSATLTAGGTPLSGRSLLFKLNGVTVGSINTDSNGVATISNISIGTLGAGSAKIDVSFAGDQNNLPSSNSATLSIAKGSLSVTADGKSRVYGQNNPPFTGTITGIQNGDNITAVYSTTAGVTSPVGPYAINVSLLDPGSKLANYNVSITPGTLSVQATTLTAVGKSISGSEGTALSGVIVASFISNNPIATAGDFSATINWGDGHTSPGTVTLAGGVFSVSGNNTYADNGSFTISISIKDNAGQGTASPTAQAATIANIAPTPTINGAPSSSTIGMLISLTGAATDPSSADTTAGFTFAWLVTKTKGSLTTNFATGSGAAFSFTPDDAGVYTIKLTATDKDGGSSDTSRTINVTAAATGSGIILLSNSKRGALTASGNAKLQTSGAVSVNSSDAAAVVVSGNASIGASEFDVTGGTSTSGHGTISGPISKHAPALDPLADLPAPSTSGLIVRSTKTLQISGNTTIVLSPGLYIGGINISGQAHVTLSPGIYYIKGGGFTVSGQAMLTDLGKGVMIYNDAASAADGISFTGNGRVQLSPISSGIYQGITLFQSRSATATISVTGNGNLSVTGAVYAASAGLSVTGNGGTDMKGTPLDTFGSLLIVDNLNVTGNGTMTVG
ncbi:MAG TPA: PKD domain-containing protein [Humisphaera sp.]|nr:PKD domain-containing protein [Humisphaera sp.]